MARATMAGEENQSASLPWSSMICSDETQTMSRPRPTPSTGALRPGVSRPFMPRAQPMAQRIPIGTLIRKIHDQVALSEIQPPRIGPHTGAAMVVIDQMALAVPACFGGKMARSRASEPGIIGPDTAPWSRRKAISTGRFQAIPQRPEAMVNRTTEAMKVRTGPNRIIIQPEIGTETPLAMAKKVMTQVPWSGLTPRSPAMVGIATLAMEVSRTCMKVPAAIAKAVSARASPFSGGRPSSWAAWDIVGPVLGWSCLGTDPDLRGGRGPNRRCSWVGGSQLSPERISAPSLGPSPGGLNGGGSWNGWMTSWRSPRRSSRSSTGRRGAGGGRARRGPARCGPAGAGPP